MDTWVLALVLIGCSACLYSDFRRRKAFALVLEQEYGNATEINRQRGIIWTHEDTIRDHKKQIEDQEDMIEGLRDARDKHAKRILSLEDSYRAKCKEVESRNLDANALKERIKKSDAAYETLRMEYDQLHAAHKMLTHDLNMTKEELRELNAMMLQRDRLLEVIKLRDEKIDKLIARNSELNAQIDGLKYKCQTRGGQTPDLNTAWHMNEKPIDVKQQYLLDDTPLDDSGSGVIDSQPYGE